MTITEERQKTDRAERLEIYKLMVEMADRVSQRRQAANTFYLSINTFLIGGSAYLGTTSPSIKSIFLISVAGILVCAYWVRAIHSYKTLNAAKFAVINNIELGLLLHPFTEEWQQLDPDGDGERHKPFHKTEKTVPKIFAAMYAVQALCSVPLWDLLESLTKAIGSG